MSSAKGDRRARRTASVDVVEPWQAHQAELRTDVGTGMLLVVRGWVNESGSAEATGAVGSDTKDGRVLELNAAGSAQLQWAIVTYSSRRSRLSKLAQRTSEQGERPWAHITESQELEVQACRAEVLRRRSAPSAVSRAAKSVKNKINRKGDMHARYEWTGA
jgi:hypothetical protein